MRELRKDIDSRLESSSKDEIDTMDEIKIEDVIMGLKGLKQEEVFSLLGKSNFNPNDTEDWLQTMSPAGFGSNEHLNNVDPAEIEQLQLNLNTDFDGLQASNTHAVPSNVLFRSKSGIGIRCKPKLKQETNTIGVIPQPESIPSMWPKYIENQTYSLNDYQPVDIREEEILATNVAEELIITSNLNEEDDVIEPDNSYVIQSPTNSAYIEEKPKPIKLLIKRIESEDELVSDSSVKCSKSKRKYDSAKRKSKESPPEKKHKGSSHRESKRDDDHLSSRVQPTDEMDFHLSNNTRQNDDYVYPSLDASDDEDPRHFGLQQGDDEIWTPKNSVKLNQVKSARPARNRKCNDAVVKFLEAAASRRSDSSTKGKKKSKALAIKPPSKVKNTVESSKCDPLRRELDARESIASIPSTSGASITVPVTNTKITPSVSTSQLSVPSVQPKKRGRKRGKTCLKSHKLKLKPDTKGTRLVPPKTCKLLQMSRGPVVADPHPVVPKKSKGSGNTANVIKSDSKSASTSYITKRGKPKKGMATAKQRLGKILKMHKMFF